MSASKQETTKVYILTKGNHFGPIDPETSQPKEYKVGDLIKLTDKQAVHIKDKIRSHGDYLLEREVDKRKTAIFAAAEAQVAKEAAEAQAAIEAETKAQLGIVDGEEEVEETEEDTDDTFDVTEFLAGKTKAQLGVFAKDNDLEVSFTGLNVEDCRAAVIEAYLAKAQAEQE